MKHYSEGDLRAWLDGEFDGGGVTAHLESCAACRGLHDELAARATFVMSAMEELPLVRVERRPAPVAWWRWAVPAFAMAACLLAVVVLRPTPVKIVPQQVAIAAIQPFPAATHDPQPVVTHPMVSHRAVVSKKAVAVNSEPEHFVALDNEPIESGVVVRVGTESGGFQADVIVGPDGRARAIRILTESDY